MIEPACRIVILEDQLEEALRLNERLRRSGAGSEAAAGRAEPGTEGTDGGADS